MGPARCPLLDRLRQHSHERLRLPAIEDVDAVQTEPHFAPRERTATRNLKSQGPAEALTCRQQQPPAAPLKRIAQGSAPGTSPPARTSLKHHVQMVLHGRPRRSG